VNLPKRVLDVMFDKNSDMSGDYGSGKMMVRYTYELITDIDKLSELATKGESNG